jgi:hypothetical protein
VVPLGGGSSDMVAALEVVFLILFVALSVWWIRRTNLYRAHRRSAVDRVQDSQSSGRMGSVPSCAPPPTDAGS